MFVRDRDRPCERLVDVSGASMVFKMIGIVVLNSERLNDDVAMDGRRVAGGVASDPARRMSNDVEFGTSLEDRGVCECCGR